MTDDPHHRIGPGYAIGQLLRALRSATVAVDPGQRRSAEAKAARWTAVIDGLAGGELAIGSRTPVIGTPAWVTVEVAHGGFATGRYLAEGGLREDERELLAQLPADSPGSSERERLNLYFLADEGLARLLAALRAGCYAIEVAEEAALPTVAWLLDRGQAPAALDLLATLRPWMGRLRFYPRLTAAPRRVGNCVHLRDVGELVRQIAATEPASRVTTMNATLAVWNPLYHALVGLWLATVEGEAPHLATTSEGRLVRDERGQGVAQGGWPGRRWPSGWNDARARWLARYRAALAEHGPSGRHHAASGTFQNLRAWLERCPGDTSALVERELAALRYVLAGAVHKHGVPGSAEAEARRAEQQRIAALPLHVDLAAILLARLAAVPHDQGLADLELVTRRVVADEHPRVPAETAIPRRFVGKAERALEAPIPELVARGILGSAELLAVVLPQLTAGVAAAGIDDATLRELFAQLYRAFRARRSLLLVDLAAQVSIDELPWVAALGPQRQHGLDSQALARATLDELTRLTFTHFPQTVIPNPLLRELVALARQAELELPFVEEIAADIFMGTFTHKFADAAELCARLLAGRLYARYYDLPEPGRPRGHASRWGRRTDPRFDDACRTRAAEAGSDGGSVARNGAILEQSQILTGSNLPALVVGLELEGWLAQRGHELAGAALGWALEQLSSPPTGVLPRLRAIKNSAYAWRQGIFFLSFVDAARQRELVDGLVRTVAGTPAWERLSPALLGLKMVVDGGRFDARGRGAGSERRLLGWTCGRHWLMPG